MIRWMVALHVTFFAMVGKAEGEKGKAVELSPTKIYVPRTGFDDNDRVEVVLEGELPNPCFTLTETIVEKSQATKRFHVRQMAWRRLTGACDTGDLIDDPIPFTVTALLGQLNAGEYKVSYREAFGPLREKSFLVDEAKSSHIDNFYYAIVSQINSEDSYGADKPFRVLVKGQIPSTCLELDPEAKVEVQADTILIMPALRTNLEDCHPTSRSFQHEFTVLGQPAGNYLIHVRTRGGSALYRPVTLGAQGISRRSR